MPPGDIGVRAQESESSSEPDVAVEKVRRWVAAREMLNRERSAWETDREMLRDLIRMREREVGELDEVIALASKRVDEVEETTRNLEEEQKNRAAWRDQFEDRVQSIEDALIEALPTFPRPLRDDVSDAILRLEDRDDGADVQSRFRDVLQILNQWMAFRAEIHHRAETREIGGKNLEVDVLYLGTAQAWYVDRSGSRAGVGWPTDEGWVWRENDAIASEVRRGLAIHGKEAVPGFVRLPLIPHASP